MPKLWLPQQAAQEYFSRRQSVGPDPFPEPQTEREEIVHQLWQLRISVAGWWTLETSYLRDLLHKYLQEQPAEALRMQKEAEERRERQARGPSRKEISEGLNDLHKFNMVRKSGARRIYLGSGTEALSE